MPQQNPRLLIIGANGFVGGWVARTARNQFDVIEGTRLGGTPSSVRIDVTQPASVKEAFDAAKPDVVLLTAAMADIDKCEQEKDLVGQINYQGPIHIARQCKIRRSRLIFCSTDAVFDGKLASYNENATPTPVNEYGRTKARAEKAIVEILPESVILRFSLVLGTAPVSGTNSYVNKLSDQLHAGQKVQTPTFEYRNPIDVARLAAVMIDLAGRNDWGIFHVGASDKMSRYELARALAMKWNLSPDLIVPLDKPIAGRAPRGLDDFLVCERLPASTGFVVPTCEEVIESAVNRTS